MSGRGRPRGFAALTFDCYGTLIDWERGVAEGSAAIPGLAGCDLARLVADRELAERDLEAGPYLAYGVVLARSLRQAAARQGREIGEADAEAFARGMEAWPPFEDSGPALRLLARRHRLAILSNVETRVLKRSVERLEAPFELLVTAEELRSYKPRRAHFDAAVERLGLPRERVLHVAVSLFHDIRPAGALGFGTAWVNRGGEPRPADVHPRFETRDLASLARLLDEA